MARSASIPTVLVLALGAALLPAAAGAAPGGRAKRAPGPAVKLTWPLRGQRATVLPGAVVTVKVRALRSRSAPVTVTLTRVSDRRTLKRRTLRAGTFRAKLPAAAGVSYVLSAKAGGRALRRTTLVVPKVAPRGPPPGWTPPPMKPPWGNCDAASAAPSGTLVGDKSVIDYGETLTATFTNTGGCLVGGVGYGVERRGEDGVWRRAGARLAFPDIGVLLEPGARQTIAFRADDRDFEDPTGAYPLPPGRYRLVQTWYRSFSEIGAGAPAAVTATWEFGLRIDDAGRCGQPPRTAAARLTGGSETWDLLRIANDGGVCVRVPDAIAIERVLGDGSTEPAGSVVPSTCARRTAVPGTTVAFGFAGGTIPPLLTPGRYRATTAATAVPFGAADQALPLTVDFELDRAIGGPPNPMPMPGCVPPPWDPSHSG